MRALFYLHSTSFSHFLEKRGRSVLGRFFPARPQLFAAVKESE
jgi:hypothetical protein